MLGLFVHGMFYQPYSRNSLRVFHSPGQLHNGYQGLDFFCMLRGFFEFSHGGMLIGYPRPDGSRYGGQLPVNLNVYHPLTTIAVGGSLSQFSPFDAPHAWSAIKLVGTLLGLVFLLRSYRQSPHLPLAVLIYLCSLSQIHEIQIAQYQWLANILLLLALHTITREQSWRTGAFSLLLALVKPISLVWIPLLLIRKNWRAATMLGIGYLALTLPWLLIPAGSYFFDNINNRVLSGTLYSGSDMFSLSSLTFAYNLLPTSIAFFKGVAITALVTLAVFTKISLFNLCYLSTLYWLSFDQLIYEYHFTVLIPFAVLGVLTQPSWQTPIRRMLAFSTTFPSAYFIVASEPLASWGLIDYWALSVPGWTAVVLSKNAAPLAIAALVVVDLVRPAAKTPEATIGEAQPIAPPVNLEISA